MRHIITGLIIFLMASLSGCAHNATSDSGGKKPVTVGTMELYEVHHDGRIHVFYNKKLYKEYLKLGETSFRLTRIGAGPKGETIVFGLTKSDKKLKKPVPAIGLYEDKVKAESFYGEMHKHGRIYVFSKFDDMKTVRDFGHPNFMHTKIGIGPKGETVVFVLNKKNKKKYPYELVAQFKRRNSF